ALGGSGSGLGYGGNGAINNSASLQYNLSGGTHGTVGFGTNGTMNDSTVPGFRSGRTQNPPFLSDPLTITLAYDAQTQTITETFYDISFNVSNTSTYTNVNLVSLVGSNICYIGFTGGTAANGANQNISNFSVTNGGRFGAVSLTNPITTASNTSSVITA